jgi:hypothetical protein
MLTSTTPAFAVAYCTKAHSTRFGLQMPIRSPVSKPAASRARATRSTSASNSA